MRYTAQNCVAEWAYSSGKAYADPFNELQLDLLFTDPEGGEQLVPAFWAGEQTWRVRYAPAQVGTYRYRTICSDPGNADLHGQEGLLQVAPYEGSNPLLRHGRLRLSADRRHLEHRDGTPFFWLGDTWWMGLCRRLSWPQDFQELTAERVAKGFTLIQIVAGLYPEMDPFDERGANEAGFPWEPGFTRINPTYFDMADIRIAHMVRAGLVPCLFGSWGFYMDSDIAGPAILKKHWRNLIARYAAYPVVWCAAGEAVACYYRRPPGTPWEIWERRPAWTELVRYIRATDGQGNLVTIHPTRDGHEQVEDSSVLDVDLLQTGHAGYPTLAHTVNKVGEALAHKPALPVVVSEVCYEGIRGTCRDDNQRFLFWSCLLSGAGGHTYGANGLWQVNTREKPFGRWPNGSSWGDTPWEDAARLPGSRQLGLGKRLLERYPWWRFEPHPEWIEPHQTPEDRMAAYAAGIPGGVRVFFLPPPATNAANAGVLQIRALDAGRPYHGFYFDPQTGKEYAWEQVVADAQGDIRVPKPPILQDWVVVLEPLPA